MNKTDYEQTDCLREAFPTADEATHARWEELATLVDYWNARINLISRKDIRYLFPRHILHSLSLAPILSFQPGAEVLDLGTGGGFPGLPLAILFPDTHFYLVDSIQKKAKAVESIRQSLGLTNVTVHCQRAEEVDATFDFVVSRAVAPLSKLCEWTRGKIKKASNHSLKNGLLCWKGGDLSHELATLSRPYRIYPLQETFDLPFLQDKAIIHVF